MFPRQDRQGEVPKWTRLGTFAGGELAFLRELLQDEGIAHREESLPGHGGAVRSELWVTSLQQARAVALVAEARGLKQGRAWVLRQASKLREHSTSSGGVRILGGLLATLILVLVLIGMLGARYGTRAPTPGHNGKTIACRNRFQVVCF